MKLLAIEKVEIEKVKRLQTILLEMEKLVKDLQRDVTAYIADYASDKQLREEGAKHHAVRISTDGTVSSTEARMKALKDKMSDTKWAMWRVKGTLNGALNGK